MKIYQLAACTLVTLLSNNFSAMDSCTQKPVPVKTIRLTAPAKNDLNEPKFFAGTINIYSSNIHVAAPICKTEDERRTFAHLLKSVFFKRLKADREMIHT